MFQLFFWRLSLCLSLCNRLCLWICVPYSYWVMSIRNWWLTWRTQRSLYKAVMGLVLVKDEVIIGLRRVVPPPESQSDDGVGFGRSWKTPRCTRGAACVRFWPTIWRHLIVRSPVSYMTVATRDQVWKVNKHWD